MSDRTIAVRIRAEYQGFKSAMADIRTESRKTAASLDADGNKITTTSGRMVRSAEVNRDAWEKSGRALTLFGAAGAAALAFSARAAIDWESAWAGVLKTVDGTHDELAQLQDDLRGMALVLPATATEIAEVAAQAGQLGVKVQDVAAFTRVMVDLGETTNLAATEAATALARMANIMGTTVSDVARMGATIVDLGNNSATTEAEIVDLGLRLAAAGKQAGLSEAEVLAFASALTSVGVPSEAAGTAISKVMTAISDAVKDGGADLETFAKVAGVSTAEFQRAFEEDAASAIGSFIEGMGNMSASGQSTTAIFDDLGLADERLKRSVLSLGSAHGLLTDQLALANTAWDENTALVEEANKRYDTTEAKVQIARNALNEAAITVGEDLLPALASLAEGLADVTTWLGNLPDPVRQVTTGLVGVTSVAALAAGGFLILFPRIVEVRKAMQTLSDISPRAASGIKSVGKGAGIAAIGIVALVAAAEGMDALYTSDQSIADITQGLLDLGGAATEASTSIDMPLWYDMRDTFDLIRRETTGIGGAMRNISNVWLFGQADKLNGLDASRKKFEEIGVALANIYASNPDVAADRFEAILAETGGTTEELLDLMPAYSDALTDTESQSRLTAGSTAELTAAQEEQAAAQQQATDALNQWRDMVSASDASFIGLQDAYSGVIAKNTEWAQSTADSTESADDSWQDYYDGQTVSAADYIAGLQAQVDAQNEWEANMTAITRRLNINMTGEMRDAANAMIDELLTLGPEGAAQVALLRSMTDEELAQVVTLYQEKGAAAISAFNTQIESAKQPNITPQVNMFPATQGINAWWDSQVAQRRTLHVATSWSGGQTRAEGGPIHGPGSSTSDDIPIWASDGEYMVRARAHSFWGTRGMDAINNADPSGLMQILAARGFRDGGSISNVTYEGSTSVSGDQFSGDVVLRVDADSIGEVQQLIQRAKTERIRARQGGTRS